MEDRKKHIIIIGAGLTGLTLAYRLSNDNLKITIIEARNRCGGRIHTELGEQKTPMEMGATWFGNQHIYLLKLLEELKVDYFPQHNSGKGIFETMSFVPAQEFEIPPSQDPFFRIKNGSNFLIDSLLEQIKNIRIILNAPVLKIKESGTQVMVHTKTEQTHLADLVVTTIPPALLNKTITFLPYMPQQHINIFSKTHIWMGDSIKFAVEYEKPFWRENGFSGTVYSQSGISPEMYDHSNAEATTFALKGFLRPFAAYLTAEERQKKVIEQLVKLFGKSSSEFLCYKERLWGNEPFTFLNYHDIVLPHQNNGHPIFQKKWMNGKLIIAGTETSPQFGGYMEGAVFSANAVAESILNAPTNFE